MCEANVYLEDEAGNTTLVLDAVDKVIPMENNHIFLENIYGERKTIQAKIKEMHLVNHQIILM
jgi:predicted RNA-binding protein